jgi:diaminopimelate epimerase
MRFTKMHGLGNDYIYLDGLNQDLGAYSLPDLARVLSDRHFGIGGDGVILILPSAVADFRMRVFNADGSEAQMCGNGIRAFAKYVYEHGLTDKTELAIETAAGIIRPQLVIRTEAVVRGREEQPASSGHRGTVVRVRVDMGAPRLARRDLPMTGHPADGPAVEVELPLPEQTLRVTCVSMGNPHCVTFVDEVADYPVPELGPLVEHHPFFPERTNVEFATVVDRQRVKVRVWERGAGETLACGTGACAVVVAGVLTGRLDRHVRVHLPGGELDIEWAPDQHVYMAGPAAEVCSGEVSPELLASVPRACA